MENRRMKDPLSQAGADLDDYKHKLKDHDYMRMMFDNCKGVLKHTEAQLRDSLFQKELISQQLFRLRLERDDIYKTFLKSVREVHQKSGFKNLLIEKKMMTLSKFCVFVFVY